MTTEYFVRLKPRATKKRKGVPQTPERYMIHGLRFEEARGWYRIVDRELAKELRLLTHNDREDGILIFDVVTKEEAERIQASERRSKVRLEVADADIIATPVSRASRRAGAVTTADTKFEAESAMIDPAPDGEEDDEDGDMSAEPIGALPADDDPEDLGGQSDEDEGADAEPERAKPAASPPARARRAAAPPAKAKKR